MTIEVLYIAGQKLLTTSLDTDSLVLNIDFLPKGFFVVKVIDKTTKKKVSLKLIKN